MSDMRHWSAISLDACAAESEKARRAFAAADDAGDESKALRAARAMSVAALVLETAAASAAGAIDRMWLDNHRHAGDNCELRGALGESERVRAADDIERLEAEMDRISEARK